MRARRAWVESFRRRWFRWLPSVETPAAPDLLSGLGAYYRLDGDLTDSSGNGRHLVDGGGTTYAPAVLNQGLATGGGQLAAVWPSTQIQATSASVAGWFYADGATSGSVAAGGRAGWVFYNIQYRTAAASPKQFFRVKVGAFTFDTLTVTPDAWHHVAAVWEIHPTEHHLHIYLDGVLALTHVGIGITGAFSDILIDATNDFSSDLDEIALYDQALSAEEVLLLFNDGDGFDPTTGGAVLADAFVVPRILATAWIAGRVSAEAFVVPRLESAGRVS